MRKDTLCKINIKKIKGRARQVQNMNKAQYVRILLIIILLELIPKLFDIGKNILYSSLYIIISIALISVSHGYIVSSLKMVRNQSQILTNDDAFVGFKRFKELFSTYLLKNVLTIVLGSSAILILSIILGLFLAEASTKLSSQAVLSNDYTQIISSVANLPVSMLAVVLPFI